MDLFDTHSHLIPNLDDGPETEEEVLRLLQHYVQNNVTRVICTPHIFEGLYNNNRATILEGFNRLKKIISENKFDLEIFPGSEVMGYFNLEKDLFTDKILTVNDGKKYLFIEFPLTGYPNFFEELLFKIQISGINPILAHPERYSFIVRNPYKIFDLVSRDIFIQLNSGSILGKFGKDVQKTAEFLVKHRLFHLIGTDSHSPNSRPPDLLEVFEKLSKELTEQELDIVFKNNPEALVSNKPLLSFDPVPVIKPRTRFLNLIKKIFKSE